MADIVYVDEKDNAIGSGSINEAIEKGIIHRIVEVFLINSKGELLIQKRSKNMMINPDKWIASSAGHVDEGESYAEAAARETKEEIGVEGVLLKEFAKIYMVENLENGKKKKRFSALYTGLYDGEIEKNPEEVAETRWISPTELKAWIARRQEDFTEWFLRSFKEFLKLSAQNKSAVILQHCDRVPKCS